MNRSDPPWRRVLDGTDDILEAYRRQQQHRSVRFAQVREASNRSRRIERERKARLAAETAAILADRQPMLRKAKTR